MCVVDSAWDWPSKLSDRCCVCAVERPVDYFSTSWSLAMWRKWWKEWGIICSIIAIGLNPIHTDSFSIRWTSCLQTFFACMQKQWMVRRKYLVSSQSEREMRVPGRSRKKSRYISAYTSPFLMRLSATRIFSTSRHWQKRSKSSVSQVCYNKHYISVLLRASS